MKTISVVGVTCHCGESARDNWNLLDLNLSAEFTFFHLTNLPSCYIIAEKSDLTGSEMIAIAGVCKSRTKYRAFTNVKVDYTSLGNVEKGDEVGEVVYMSNRQVKTVTI